MEGVLSTTNVSANLIKPVSNARHSNMNVVLRNRLVTAFQHTFGVLYASNKRFLVYYILLLVVIESFHSFFI